MSARPWFREPMMALVIGLPLAAVAAGIATLVLAAQGGDSGDRRVRRVAQTQTADLSADHAAVALGLAGIATLGGDGVLRVTLDAREPAAPTLRLTLRHGTDPRRDRSATLSRVTRHEYEGLLDGPLAAGAYNAELEPEDRGWRLVGRLEENAVRLPLVAAVGG